MYGALSIADSTHLDGVYGSNLLASFASPQPSVLMIRELSDYKPDRFVWECLEAVDEILPKEQWISATDIGKWYMDEKQKVMPWDNSEVKANESTWGKVLNATFSNLRSGREYRGRNRETVYQNVRRKVQASGGVAAAGNKDFFTPEQEKAVFQKLSELGLNNFARRRLPGLGNCAVLSVANQIDTNDTILRSTVQAWVVQNKEFQSLLEAFPDDRNLSVDQLITKMGQDREWVGAEFFAAACRVLDRTIVSVSPSHVLFYPNPENEQVALTRSDTIFVAYNDSNHYDCLVRKF